MHVLGSNISVIYLKVYDDFLKKIGKSIKAVVNIVIFMSQGQIL